MVGVREVQGNAARLQTDKEHLYFRVLLESLQNLVPRSDAHVPRKLVALPGKG